MSGLQRSPTAYIGATAAILVLSVGAASGKSFQVPRGVEIRVKVDRVLESRKEMDQRSFFVVASVPLRAEGCLLLKEGAAGEGQVAGVSPPARRGVPGRIKLRLLKLTLSDGRTTPFATEVLERVGPELEKVKLGRIPRIRKGNHARVEPSEELVFRTAEPMTIEMECVR